MTALIVAVAALVAFVFGIVTGAQIASGQPPAFRGSR
jgi:hypothetical protein